MPPPKVKVKVKRKNKESLKQRKRGKGVEVVVEHAIPAMAVPRWAGIRDKIEELRRRRAERSEERTTAREVCDAAGWDPVEHMVLTAMGDVVRLGLMTQGELDAPAREFELGGHLVKRVPSGQEKALELLPPMLRLVAAREVAPFIYSKRGPAPHVDDDADGKRGGGVVVYVPDNGRGPPPKVVDAQVVT